MKEGEKLGYSVGFGGDSPSKFLVEIFRARFFGKFGIFHCNYNGARGDSRPPTHKFEIFRKSKIFGFRKLKIRCGRSIEHVAKWWNKKFQVIWNRFSAEKGFLIFGKFGSSKAGVRGGGN